MSIFEMLHIVGNTIKFNVNFLNICFIYITGIRTYSGRKELLGSKIKMSSTTWRYARCPE